MASKGIAWSRWLLTGAVLLLFLALTAWGASVVRRIATRSARHAADSTARAEQAKSRAAVIRLRVEAESLTAWGARERAKSAAAMARSARHRRAAAVAGDSITGLLAQLGARDSGGVLIPVDTTRPLDTIALAATCAERYRLRTVQTLRLEEAQAECEAAQRVALFRGDSLQGELYRQADQMAGEYNRNDSLWRWRYDHKPCTRNWGLVRPPCWVQDVGIVVGTLLVRKAVN